MDRVFENRVVMISGGLGDIGRAMALLFAEKGASIALCDLLPLHSAKDLLAELEKHGASSTYATVDVSDVNAVERWVSDVEQSQGVPTIILANAATVTIANIKDIKPDQWSREMEVNLNGAFFLAQLTTSRLLYHSLPGRIVFIGSWAAYTPHTHIPAYCVSKAAIRMLCKCMALELAPHRILVNEVAPGFVEAGLSRRVWEGNPELANEALNKVPIKKLISPEAVAVQVLNLCHPDNEHMTGATILMDGGLSLLS